MNKEVRRFADFLIECITSRNYIDFNRESEFGVISVIVRCVELYESEGEEE